MVQTLRLRELLASLQTQTHSPTQVEETTSPEGNGVGEEDDVRNDPCQEPAQRALMRILALTRGNRDTGYANSWLNVVPCSAHGTKMNKVTFGVALKWMLGDVICPEGQCPESSAASKRCPHALDPWGDHAVCCPTGPSRIARHDHVNATWLATLGASGYHVRAEVRTGTFVYNWDKGRPRLDHLPRPPRART